MEELEAGAIQAEALESPTPLSLSDAVESSSRAFPIASTRYLTASLWRSESVVPTARPTAEQRRGHSVDPRDVTVLLATINERANLPQLLSEIERECGVGVQVVVVDDGSSDGSREFLQQVAKLNGSLRCIFNPAPQTIVGAHIQGITTARTPFIVVMDSDGQHPPSAIPRILEGLRNGNDVVIGTRFGPGGSTGGRTAFRGLVSRVAAAMIQVTIANTRAISDPTSGFFGVRRAALEPFTRDLRGYETLVFVLAMMKTPRLGEVPYRFRERANGQSKVIRGFSFFRVFFTQLVAAKRTELDARRRRAERARNESPVSVGRIRG